MRERRLGGCHEIFVFVVDVHRRVPSRVQWRRRKHVEWSGRGRAGSSANLNPRCHASTNPVSDVNRVVLDLRQLGRQSDLQDGLCVVHSQFSNADGRSRNELTLAYTSVNDQYAIGGDGLTNTYGPADLDPAAANGIKGYVRVSGGFTERFSIARPMIGGIGLDYARTFSLRVLRYAPFEYSCVFGVPTLTTDVPASSSVTYSRVGLTGSAYRTAPGTVGVALYSLEASTATLSVNLVTETVSTTIHLLGTLQTSTGASTTNVELGTYVGTGTIDVATGSYSGQFADAGGASFFAYFGGGFFGPQGREAAYAYSLAHNDATGAVNSVGTVAASR